MPGENEKNRKCNLDLFDRERASDGLTIATKFVIAVLVEMRCFLNWPSLTNPEYLLPHIQLISVEHVQIVIAAN